MPYSKPSDPIVSANQLSEALRLHTIALDRVRKRYRVIGAFLIITMAVLIFSVFSRHQSRVSFCEQDNRLRTGLQHVADQIEDAVRKPISSESREFIDGLRRDFAIQDCNIPWF